MDIKNKEAFESKFKLNAIYERESRIRKNNILEFAETAGIYFNIVTNNAWELWQAAQAVPEWNSIDDKEPPLGTMVLICWSDAPDVEPEKDYMDHDVDHGVNYWANYNDGDEPSHWMLLPKPVAQEQSHDSESFK